MLSKIVSGGQTGVDRAALDVAIELDIPYSGWIPKGRLAEDGMVPEKYKLKEMPNDRYVERTEQNVVDSDGTLIIARGTLSGGSAYTRKMAMKHGKPWSYVDLDKIIAFQAAITINDWLIKHNIEVLNVAGPRHSGAPQLYGQVKKILESVYWLNISNSDSKGLSGGGQWPFDTQQKLPTSVAEIVDTVLAAMALKDRALLAKMQKQDLFQLDATIGAYLYKNLKIWSANKKLWSEMETMAGKKKLDLNDAVAFLIEELWQATQKTHKLRLIK
jgi:hypothetical protein